MSNVCEGTFGTLAYMIRSSEHAVCRFCVGCVKRTTRYSGWCVSRTLHLRGPPLPRGHRQSLLRSAKRAGGSCGEVRRLAKTLVAKGFRCAYYVGMDQPHKLRRPLVRQVVVNHPNGLHVRPSTAIVKTVRRFQSSVRIQYQDREADAAEILDILALRVPQNAGTRSCWLKGWTPRRSSMPS